MPVDFGKDKKTVVVNFEKALRSGKYAIDWWESTQRGYFIRPAIKGITDIFDGAWKGECIFLTPTGCELSYKLRPTGCRLLEPSKSLSERCQSHGGTKEEAKKAWRLYRKMIIKIGKQIEIEDGEIAGKG